MADILEQLAICIESGKVNADATYPPSMKGQDGAAELTASALQQGIPPKDILAKALIAGMSRIGQKFSDHKAFVPDLLMSAKAMSAAMEHLKPYFESGEAQHLGTFVIGTVQGDMHDIGKNLVGMVVEGGGWKVVDLGVDVPPEDFVAAIGKHPGCVVGLSALLTTTMASMDMTVKRIKEASPDTFVMVGGAPLTSGFAAKIGADAYEPDPQHALNRLSAMGA